MKRRLIIEYWYNDTNDIDDFELKEMLEEHASDRILSQIASGYTSGELRFEDDDSHIYVGGWSMTTECL